MNQKLDVLGVQILQRSEKGNLARDCSRDLVRREVPAK